MKQKITQILMALLVAFGVWVYVVTVVSPESEATYYNIPVVLSNESVLRGKGLMVLSDSNPTVTLQLRGNRSDLNNLKNSDITAIADLAKINDAGEQSLSISFTGINAYEILNQDPGQITLQIVEWSTKEVDVTFNYTGSVGADYVDYRDEIIADRQKITISGPKSVVNRITQARVDVDLTGQTETISESKRYTLCDENGNPVDASNITTNAAEVSYTLKIYRVREIQLLVEVIYGGGATPENTTVTQNYETIRVAGSEILLNDLSDIIKIGTINLAEVTENTQMFFPVNLNEELDNLSNIKEVQVSITVPERITNTISIPVSDVEVIGLPEGMTLNFVTQVVNVTVRGREDQVNEITAEDIRISIDVTGATPTKNEPFKALAEIDSSFTDVDVTVSDNIHVDILDNAGGT